MFEVVSVFTSLNRNASCKSLDDFSYPDHISIFLVIVFVRS